MDNIKIFFIDTNKFLDKIDKTTLDLFAENNKFRSTKRQIQFCLGRFLLKYVLLTQYNISNPQICLINQKPCLKNNTQEIQFSLSHTQNIIWAAFCRHNIGTDIEFMKNRNFEKIFKHYKLKPANKDKKTFYQLWTEYESEIKLQREPKATLSAIFANDFMFSITTDCQLDIKNRLKIYEIDSPNIKPDELINLGTLTNKNETASPLVTKEINTVQSDFLPSQVIFLDELNIKIK